MPDLPMAGKLMQREVSQGWAIPGKVSLKMCTLKQGMTVMLILMEAMPDRDMPWTAMQKTVI